MSLPPFVSTGRLHVGILWMSHSFNDVDCLDWFTQLANMKLYKSMENVQRLAWQSNETSFCLFFSMIWSTQDFIILSRNTHVFSSENNQPGGSKWSERSDLEKISLRTFLRMWLDGASSLVIGDGAGCVETLLFNLISRILWDDSLLYSRSLRSFHVKCATTLANIN